MNVPRIPALLMVGLLLVVPACSSDGDGSASADGAPATEPPWGLDETPVPTSQEEIDEVLGAMPTDLDGLTGAVGGNEIGYGAGGMGEVAGSMETFLRIMTIGGEEYGQGASFIGAIVQGGGIEVEGQELDPEAPIVYLAGLTPAGDITYASMMWAEPASPFVLLIQGTSPEQREMLIAAYEQAAATALG